jgi:predicted ATPase/signal transduction histidine kinase
MNTTVNTTVALAGYRLLERLYSGSRTVVYRGIRLVDDQPVIVKLLQQDYPSFHDLLQFRNQYAIMRRIADANAKNLNIPGIIRPYSLEPYRNSYALVMEDFGGVSLRDYTGNRRLAIAEVLSIALQLAQILHDLHASRVIHKDIKPANILIHPETKQVKLIDFSIASLLPKETQEIKNPNRLEGTLAYLAPEQTGRMNRGIDYRSDFYALGVTLFELLTGQLPFQSDDPMELVHCHIAKQPPSLGDGEEIPPVLADMVMKLMAKNAEERYQSALGLKYDLEICLHQLKEKGEIEVFEIAQRDLCDRFIIPEKLYGRETEVQALLNAFERVSQGHTELMLVAGFSGIGKTAAINEVHKPIVRQRGYFIKGKFDQFNRNIPFSAFVQAFRDLMGQLLSESDALLAAWKAKILDAVGENGQVIIDVIPELEQIIGQQPTVPELSGSAAQNRFNLLFQKFIQVFTTPAHPLVMFLDDLQWADSASLNLLQLLMSEASSGYLLILGAYRDNEVFPAHPLMLTLEQIQKTQAIVHRITLVPLLETTVNQLVADTLSCTDELAQPLTQLVYQKTQGNPFFTNQFLKALHEDGWIEFQPELGYWQCDMAAVRQLALTDDVVEFMALQLQKLPVETQEVLKLAACIGNQFDLNTLALVSEQSETEAATALWKALQEGLILPISETYKFFQANDSDGSDSAKPTLRERSSEIPVSYKFLHDRVQQAAYSLIPDTDKATVHQTIGRLFLDNCSEQECHERIFEIVNHLNQAIHLVEQPSERERLAQLNLKAGQKAKAATAYQTALSYLVLSSDLLPENSWQQHYDFTLTLHTELASNTCLVGDFAATERWLTLALDRVESLLDRIPLYEIQIQAHVAQSQLQEAIGLGCTTLQQLGIALPTQPTPEDFGRGLAKINGAKGDRPVAELIHLPIMTEPRLLAAMRVLFRLAGVVVLAAPHLMPFIFFKMVSLSIQTGNTAFSAPGYVTYGMILCSAVGEIDLGYAFGQLALEILDKLPSLPVQAKTLSRFHAGVRHWKENWRSILSDLQVGYQIGLETGDLETTAIFAQVHSYTAYFAGAELSELAESMAIYSQAIAQLKQPVFLRWNQTYHQHVLNLLGHADDPCQLMGEVYDETVDLPQQYAIKDAHGIAVAHLFKAIGCYLFARHEEALTHLEKVAEFHRPIASFIPGNMFYFYDALVRLALYPNLSAEAQDRCLEKVTVPREKIRRFADHAAVNWSHKADLIEAQFQQISGNRLEAMDLYDRAISGAKANEYIQEEALANELAAKFYLAWGKEKIAAGYMQAAYYCYARWGALAKTDDLETRYPQLLRPILQSVSTPSTNYLSTLVSIHQTATKSGNSISNLLDLGSFTKAAQALYSEIHLDKLLGVIMQVMVENAGADKAALILNQEGELTVAIKYIAQTVQRIPSQPLDTCNHLPVSIIRQVSRTRQPELCDRVTDPKFAADSYFERHSPQSLLCSPIVDRGKLIGILYLENSSSRNAFTRDRVEILHLLCTQAAISLENATLYNTLEQKVIARTRELSKALDDLKATQKQLVEAEKMAALGGLVAGVAHEINTPVGVGITLASTLVEVTQTFKAEIDRGQLKKSVLTNYLDTAQESASLMLTNLQRAGDLIQSFKQVAVDQTHLEQRSIALKSYLEDLLFSLSPQLRQAQHTLTLTGDDSISIISYPGAIAQLITNLLNNSLLHAYPTGAAGQLHIGIQQTDEFAILKYSDDGCGIPPENLDKIFDPFFTTARDRGGSGLGLHIVYNLVTQKLGGTIEVESTVGKGTLFVIQLPWGL